MSYRPRMVQIGSNKWARIGHHKRTHHVKKEGRSRDVFRRMAYGYHFNQRCATNPRWMP